MANGDIVYPFGTGARTKPAAGSSGNRIAERCSVFGEPYTWPIMGGRLHAASDEGSWYEASNPTPGTAIAGITAATAFDDTESLIHLINGATTAEDTRIYPQYIILQPSAVGTSGTNYNLAVKLDKGTTRYTSGGSSITPVNPNMQITASSSASLKFGALVTTAASASARLLGAIAVSTAIKVASSTVAIVFGDCGLSALLQSTGSGVTNTTIHMPPVVLGPTDQLLLHEWAASQTVAASYQFRMGWIER